ncbi:MAG: sigma-70 family RNA polymerase sigma factor, partial [Planctomycetota bacterium]
MHAEHLFEQFRRTREPARLGEVFDLCADDLFAVALHLCRDRAAAEDLVQSTFLVAIERADRYTVGRPLRPWLLGILHREAKRQRRHARRVPEAERLSVRDEAQPPAVILAEETVNAVKTALGDVPQPYRDVLELHLVQSLAPVVIAEQLQRSPGAVRTQLWRGLELLRRLLPKGLAVGLAAGLGSRQALAAVRARVVHAASSKVVGAGVGVGVVAGALVMKKVLLGIAVVLALAVVWWQSPPATVSPLAPRSSLLPEVVADVDVAAANAESAGGASELRTKVVEGAPPTVLPGPEVAPPAALSVTAQVLVLDGGGNPVADAEVCVYERARRGQDGQGEVTDERRSSEPRQRVLTNSLGRADVTIDGPLLISARKQDVGWSGDVRAQPDAAELRDEWRLVLLPTATLRGVGLLPDGAPAIGARVTGYNSNGLKAMTGDLPPMRTDREGRFACDVLVGLDFQMRASLDGRYAEREVVPELHAGQQYELTLRFPGAYSVRGVLLDADDRALQGKVYLVGAEREDSFRSNWQTQSDGEGRFEILLTRGGAFELLGGVEGQTSAQVTLVLDDARPRQQVTLHTAPFVAVAGKVVDEHGAPCAGMHVGLAYVVERDWLHERRSNLHGIMPRGPLAADGTFHFLAPAGYRYQLACQPV